MSRLIKNEENDYSYIDSLYNQLKQILFNENDKVDNEEYTSISDIVYLIDRVTYASKDEFSSIKDRISQLLQKNDFYPRMFKKCELKEDKKEMVLTLDSVFGDEKKYTFKKIDNGDFVIVDATDINECRRLLNILSDVLPKMYANLDKYNHLFSLCKKGISCDVDGFTLDLNKNGVCLKNGEFKLFTAKNSYGEVVYSLSSDSLNITKLLNDNKGILLDKIYIKISDCPEWMQGVLREKRKKQIKKRTNAKNKVSLFKLFKK